VKYDIYYHLDVVVIVIVAVDINDEVEGERKETTEEGEG